MEAMFIAGGKAKIVLVFYGLPAIERLLKQKDNLDNIWIIYGRWDASSQSTTIEYGKRYSH